MNNINDSLKLEKIEYFQSKNTLFKKNAPKNIVSGLCHGLGSISLGVVSGVVGLFTMPVYCAYDSGVKGFFKGCGLGILLFLFLPIGGLVIGGTSIIKSFYNTPSLIYNKRLGKVWDPYQQKWLYYSIEEDKSFMFSKKETDFISCYSDKDVKDLELYNVLQVTPESTLEEIKKKYHKLALKYHPDKNSGNEDDFKKINEAYKILSDKNMRDKYDKLGKEGLINISLQDCSQFYTILFGSDVLSFYIGDLYLFNIMTLDSNNTKINELLELKQRKRELKITDNLFLLLSEYMKQQGLSLIKKFYLDTRNNLLTNEFSKMIVACIGNVLRDCGSNYLYSSAYIKNYFKNGIKNIMYKFKMLKNNLNTNTFKTAVSIKNIILEDVENTIRKSIKKIFIDHTIKSSDKEKYAKGLIFIGSIFSKTEYNTKKVINIIKQIL